tara:strand:- start:1533 stop:1970 length:438 start_codon:yes stop_codon:yes gene_type:complete
MNIYLFDFDNTIVNLPYQETIEYLDQEDSLNPELNFSEIKQTKKDYQEISQNDPDGLFLLLSNRISKVKAPLKNLLAKLNYNFEDYYLIEGEDRNKGKRVKRILEKYPSCKTITYWEDKDKHINSVKEVMKEYPKITFEVRKTIL